MFLITDAILEGAQKQCSDRITDGEELRNSYILSVASQHFSIASVCLQGHSRKRCLRWLILTSGFESRNSYGLHPVAYVKFCIVLDRLVVAIFLACYRHYQALVHDLGHDNHCAYGDAGSCNKLPRELNRSWRLRCYQNRW